MAHTSPAMAATARLRCYLLGHFRLESDAGPIRLPRRKVESLLAYLLLHPEEHPREKLAALFWGDSPDAEARHSLRTALTTLRQHLGHDLLLTDRETVQLNPTYPIWADALELDRLSTRLEIGDWRLEIESPISNLQSLIALYQGDLLADFYDDWLTPLREHYRARYLEALLWLTQEMRSRSEYEQAIELARRVLASDPTHERAHQHLMVCFVASGDRHAALKQYEACQHLLQEELGVEPLPETTALYRWIKGAPAERVLPEARLTNLPIPLTSFIGRKRELAEVKRLLAPLSLVGRGDRREGGEGAPLSFSGRGDRREGGEGSTRLLTLTGAGGSGKTRLAIQAATDLVDSFKDGVWWVELAALSDTALVPQTIAKAVGIREAPNQSLQEMLVNFLQPRRLLLVLDNCEHLVAACAQLAAELLSACPYLQILATSREALGLTGEFTWPVPTLSLPDPQQLSPLQLLQQFEAIRLFVERAIAVKPDFDLTLQNAPIVAEICHRLDGIPLAIELAAARVKVLSVEQIAARLDDRFNLLTQGSRMTLPRHQTLRATIDWSYDLLTEPERALFRRLSVFAGGFTLEAAEAICAGEWRSRGAEEQSPLLDLLAHLVDKSIVVVEHQGGKARYRMLETIRQYAWEKLGGSGEVDQMRRRHLAFYLELAEEAEPQLFSAEQVRWFNRLETEHDNLRAAIQGSLESGEAEPVLRLAGALWLFWDTHGYVSEGRKWLEEALTRSGTPTAVRVKALIGAGFLAVRQSDIPRAIALFEQALALSRALGYKRGIAEALWNLGRVANFQGDAEREELLYTESLNLWRELGDKRGTAVALGPLAERARDQSDYGRAGMLYEESLALFREVGDKKEIAGALWNLGEVALLQGDYQRAKTFSEESLGLYRELGDKHGIATLLRSLGEVARNQGDIARASALAEEGVALFRELGDKGCAALTLIGLGRVAHNQNDAERVTSLCEESLALCREIGNRHGIALSLDLLGRAALSQGDEVRARLLFIESLGLQREFGHKEGSATPLEGLARVAMTQGKAERAARLLGAVEALREAIGAPIPPADRAEYDRTMAATQIQLDAAFGAAWAEGQAMTPERAVAYALEQEGP